MGAVYEVADETTHRRRALKVMLATAVGEPSLRERFAQEATITGGISSDHIVQVSDAGIDEGTGMPFLVMDLLSGEGLGELCARRGPLPPSEAALYLYQAALALDKTHAAGIVHRDLKPENLFITTRDDGSPCLKILDYGVAKLLVDTTLAQRTAIVGTPLYMAPEQIRGDGAVRPPADVYALAHVAFTMLVGEAYWMTEAKGMLSIFALFNKIVAGLPEPATARAARRGVTLPPAFDAWFQQAVAIDPKMRPERASLLVASFSEALGLSPLMPTVPSIAPPPSKRHPSTTPPRPRPPAREAPRPSPPSVRPSPRGDVPAAGSAKAAPRKPGAVDSWEDDAPLFRDEATGAYAERYLRLKLDELLSLARKRGEKLSVILFQVIITRNPKEPRTKAHTDAEVREVVQAIQWFVPREAFLGRHGPSSVVLIAPNAGLTQSRARAKVLAEKVRGQLGKREATARLSVKLRVGAARREPQDRSAVDLLERAERAAREEDV